MNAPRDFRPLDINTPHGVRSAHDALLRGGLVVVPTDTVYGIAALAANTDAVARLHSAKGRTPRIPAPVLVSDADQAWRLASFVPPAASGLARAFWPGPLTLVLPCAQPWAINQTLGVRVPNHDGLRALLRLVGPLAVSSANRHDKAPATTAAMAWSAFADLIDVYLDSGPTPGPTPSTVVDCTSDQAVVLRVGILSADQILDIAGANDA